MGGQPPSVRSGGALPRYQKQMMSVGSHIGLPSMQPWKFAAPSPATVDATMSSEKFARPLEGDVSTLQVLQRLYQPHREALLALVDARKVKVLWPSDAASQDPEMLSVSVSRWGL